MNTISKYENIKSAYSEDFHGNFEKRFNDLKLFPCYEWVDLNLNLDDNLRLCHYCQSEFRFNDYSKEFMCCLVFESKENVNLACSRKCLPENALEYSHQIYGFREPITLHQKLKNDEKYLAVYSKLFNDYKGFLLRKYKYGITQEIYYNERLDTEYSGSTYFLLNGETAECTHCTNGLHVSIGHIYKPKPEQCLVFLTIPELIKTINEIIEAYYSNQESLF